MYSILGFKNIFKFYSTLSKPHYKPTTKTFNKGHKIYKYIVFNTVLWNETHFCWSNWCLLLKVTVFPLFNSLLWNHTLINGLHWFQAVSMNYSDMHTISHFSWWLSLERILLKKLGCSSTPIFLQINCPFRSQCSPEQHLFILMTCA